MTDNGEARPVFLVPCLGLRQSSDGLPSPLLPEPGNELTAVPLPLHSHLGAFPIHFMFVIFLCGLVCCRERKGEKKGTGRGVGGGGGKVVKKMKCSYIS